jgi:hypothetical protein
MKRAWLINLVLLFLAISATGVWAAGENLIPNPGFEDGLAKWSIWKPAGNPVAELDTEVFHSGKASARATTFTPTDRIALNLRVAPKPASTYIFRAWVKTQDVSAPVVMVRIQYNATAGGSQKTASHTYIGRLQGTHDWTLLESQINVPAGTAELIIELFLDTGKGTVWWDDIELVPLESVSLSIEEAGARVLSSGVVALEWSIPKVFQDTGVTFRVYRSALKDFSTADFPAVAIIKDTKYLDRDIRANQTFYYRIIPVGEDGTYGEQSEQISATVSSVKPISVPKAFYAEWQAGQARLTWDLGDSRARQVRIERCLDKNGNPTCTLLTLAPSWVTEFQDARLTAPEGVSYRLTVVGPEGGQSVPQMAVLGGFIPRVEPIAQFGQHPALFISQPEIDAFVAQAKTDVLINQIIQLQIVTPARLATALLNSKELVLPVKNDNSAHDALAKQAREAALGYAFTGDTTMAQAAKKVLMTYANQLKNYPLLIAYDGRFHKQTLEESIWLIQIAWTYDLIYNSDVLTATDRQTIENDLLKEMIKTIDRYDKGLSNWQALHNAGIGAAAFVLGDQKWVEEVMTGPQGFTLHISEGLRDDGIWWEQAIGYHNYTLTALTYLAEMAYRYGYDLYHLEMRGKTLKAAFDGAIQHAFRSGLHPVVGNTSTSSALNFDWPFGFAAKHYQDDAYAVLARRRSSGGTGILPTLLYTPQMLSLNNLGSINVGTGAFAPGGLAIGGSSLLLDTGMSMLRSPKGSAGPDIAMLFKPHGIQTGHQAADNLTIMLAGDEGHWLSGPGSYSYDATEQGTWYKQTVARNGVVVDQRSQYPQEVGVGIFVSDGNQPSSGELLHAVALPGLGFATAATDTAYAGVQMQRMTLLHTPYVIDRYQLSSTKQHTYDYVLNITGKVGEVSIAQEPRNGALGSAAGYQHIKDLSVGQTTDTWQASWTKGKSALRLSMLGGITTEVISATGLGPSLSAQPMLLARRQAADTVFLTVMETYAKEPVVRHIEPLSAPGVSGVEVYRNSGAGDEVIDRFAWVNDGVASLTQPVTLHDGMKFQADWAFFRPATAGQTAGLLMQNGIMATFADLAITLDEAADIAVEYDGKSDVTLVIGGSDLRKVQLQSTDNQVARDWQLFKALPCDDLTEEMPEIITVPFDAEGTGVWRAEPNTLYLLSTDTPDEEWLRQLVVTLF